MGQCSSALAELRLRAPLPATLTGGTDAADLFSQILAAAQDAKPHIPLTPSLRVRDFKKSKCQPAYTVGIPCVCCSGLLFPLRGEVPSAGACSSPAQWKPAMEIVQQGQVLVF